MIDTKILYEKFLSLEKELDLFTTKINGVHFWERIRVDIYIKILKIDAGIPIPGPKKVSSKFRYYLRSITNVGRNPFLSGKKKILFAGTPRRLIRSDGYWWDIYTDPIINLLKESSLSLEYSFLFNHFNPAKTKNLRYFDFIELLGHLQQKLGISKISINEKDKHVIQTIRKKIIDEFGVDIDVSQRVTLMLERRKSRLHLYHLLLKRIKPKLVVVVVSYGKEDFIEACKSQKIPVVEFQHGVINRFHVGYSYEGILRQKLTFPDYLLSFGEYWGKDIEYPIPPEKIIPVGYPLVDEKREKYRNTERKNQIVFISQTTAGAILSKFALELSKKEGNPYEIVYKLQPQECDDWQNLYPWLIDSKVNVIDQKSDILHQILAESKIQIGISSTALYEGLAFGLRTFIVDGPGVEFLDTLVKSGIVKRTSSPDHLLTLLKESEESKSFDIEYFFKSGATKAIVKFIEKMIQ